MHGAYELSVCRPSWSLALVVTIITSGLLLLVAGETKFSLWGFIVVMTAAALSGLRWTITQVLLQGSSHTGEDHGSCNALSCVSLHLVFNNSMAIRAIEIYLRIRHTLLPFLIIPFNAVPLVWHEWHQNVIFFLEF